MMMRLTLAAVLCFSQVAHAQLSLVWSDEFDGSSIDSSNWEHMLGDGSAYGLPGWGNNEWQSYTNNATNSYVSGGNLHIVATKSGNSYYSARLRSLNKVDFQYGRIEARIKVPAGQGIWPAFWMLPTNSPYGGWAASGEIDILETINNADQAHGTIHFGDNWPTNVSNGGSHNIGQPISNDFHVYRLDWEEDQMRWYMDGIQYHSVSSNNWWSNAAPGNNRAPFDNPFHFLLNVAVGGNWPGYPDGSTPFPNEMQVDYIRVYQADTGNPGEFQNGGFEEQGAPFAFWTAYGNNIPNVRWEQLLPYEGVSHAKLFGQFIGGANDCGMYQDADAEPGELWTASVQAAHENHDSINVNNQGYMALEFVDAGGGIIVSHTIDTLDSSSPTDTYQFFSVTETAPAGTAKARINLGYHQGASNPREGAIYYDNANLDVAPGACSPADVTTQGAGAGDPLFGIPDGAITGADINFFVNAWVTLDASIADLTTQGSGPGDPGYAQPDGIVTASDINFYVNIWLFGCP